VAAAGIAGTREAFVIASDDRDLPVPQPRRSVRVLEPEAVPPLPDGG
jgi:hypothetical protein